MPTVPHKLRKEEKKVWNKPFDMFPLEKWSYIHLF